MKVSTLAFGGAPLMSRAGRGDSWQALKTAFDGGITLYDTAPLYGQGGSERLMGEFFRGRRHEVVLCSKCGQAVSEGPVTKTALALKVLARPLVHRFRPVKRAAAAFLQSHTRINDFGGATVARSVDASLHRLRTDYLDIVLLHEPDLETIRRGEAFEQLERLRQLGKIRAFGVSCNTAEEGTAAIEHAPQLSVVQVPLSLWYREPVDRLLPLAVKHEVGVVARGVFRKGDALKRRPDEPEPVTQLRQRMADLGRQRGLSIAQTLLWYTLHQPGVTSVLATMIDPQHVRENVAAMNSPLPFPL